MENCRCDAEKYSLSTTVFLRFLLLEKRLEHFILFRFKIPSSLSSLVNVSNTAELDFIDLHTPDLDNGPWRIELQKASGSFDDFSSYTSTDRPLYFRRGLHNPTTKDGERFREANRPGLVGLGSTSFHWSD